MKMAVLKILKRVENTVGKEGITCHEKFLLFLSVFGLRLHSGLLEKVLKAVFSMIVNPFPSKPLFLCECSISFLKTLEKGEIACN